MTEREDNVYKAKLAEQAERYDGKVLQLKTFSFQTRWLNFFHCSMAYTSLEKYWSIFVFDRICVKGSEKV